MLRITCVGPEAAPTAAKIEGEIAGEYVHELARFVAGARERAPRIVLDLSDVTFVDHAGAALLRTLRDQAVEFVDGSSYVWSLVAEPPRGQRTGESE